MECHPPGCFGVAWNEKLFVKSKYLIWLFKTRNRELPLERNDGVFVPEALWNLWQLGWPVFVLTSHSDWKRNFALGRFNVLNNFSMAFIRKAFHPQVAFFDGWSCSPFQLTERVYFHVACQRRFAMNTKFPASQIISKAKTLETRDYRPFCRVNLQSSRVVER